MQEELTLKFKAYFEGLLEQMNEERNESFIDSDVVQLWNGYKRDNFDLDIFEESQSRGDDGDLAMNERDKSLRLKLQARENFFRKKILKALKKLDEGSFGECEDCGATISQERLEARPTAELCIHCKEEQEQLETQIPYKRRSHTLGREIISAS